MKAEGGKSAKDCKKKIRSRPGFLLREDASADKLADEEDLENMWLPQTTAASRRLGSYETNPN